MAVSSVSEVRMSVSMVVVQCEDTLKTHIDVFKVAHGMLKSEKSREILDNVTRKYIEKSVKKGIKFFLAVIKKLDISGFVLFLESLEQVGDSKHLAALTTVATHIPSLLSPPTATPNDPLTTEAEEKLKKIHDTHFKSTKHRDLPDPECSQLSLSDIAESLPVTEAIATPHGVDTCQSLETTIPSSDAEQPEHKGISKAVQSTTSYSPSTQSHPLPDETGGSVAVRVQRGGALLYSPVHGVTVSVPASAVPSHIQEFDLRMSASLRCTIPIDSEYTPCSAVISLTTDPKFDSFSDYVTVSMPHCAMNAQDCPECYCILSHSDGHPTFVEDTSIEVDFTTQWRYLSFKTKHFTKYLSAGKRKAKRAISLRKQPDRLAKMKSKSLEHHHRPSATQAVVQSEFHRSTSDPFPQTELLLDTRFCVGMFTPRCKEMPVWKMVFLTCLDVHTGYAEMEQDALKLLSLDGIHCLDTSQRMSFTFRKDHSAIEFSPAESTCNGWRINALKTPAVITRADVLHHNIQREHQHLTSYAPHSLAYAVTKEDGAAVMLCQQFTINGALACYGNQVEAHNVSFTLVAEQIGSRTITSESSISFQIFQDLYSPTCQLLRALRGEVNPSNVPLKPDDPDTITIITELSFSMLSEWPTVAKYLSLLEYDYRNLEASYASHHQEASYQMMLTWLRSSETSKVNLQSLLNALKRIGIEVHVQTLAQERHSPVTSQEMCFHQLPRSTVDDISQRIASQWKSVGRLLGLTENDIDSTAMSGGSGVEGYPKIIEQTVAMLELWGRRNGRAATFLKLKNAIHAVHKHSHHQLWDAMDFVCHFQIGRPTMVVV